MIWRLASPGPASFSGYCGKAGSGIVIHLAASRFYRLERGMHQEIVDIDINPELRGVAMMFILQAKLRIYSYRF